RSLREALAAPARFPQAALAVEPPQALEIVAADLHVELAHLQVARQRDHLVLRREHHRHPADRARKAEHLALAETLREVKPAFAVDRGARYRLVERRIGGPLRHRLV